MMKRTPPAANPDAYVDDLDGWRREIVVKLRGAVRASAALDEVIKWGHLVYFSNGPILLIRAEDERVLFGFWRGKRLREIERRLKASGKYEMASMEMREGDTVDRETITSLAQEAVRLNLLLGDPTHAAKSK